MPRPFCTLRCEVRQTQAGELLRTVLLAFIAFFLVASLPAAGATAAQEQGRRLALLIGNSAYQKNALSNPVNDARDFGALLAESGFETLVRTDLDLHGMEAAVLDFAAGLREGDTVLVFYAGHGVESGGVNYLIPVDNAGLQSESDLKYKAYAASRVLEEVAARNAGLAILVLDACRDNPFPSRSGLSQRGLTVMAAPPRLESIILYSTAPGTTAADGTGRNSVFMRSLLAEIQTPNLSVRDVFDRVGGAVKAATGGIQVPWLNSTPLSKPFIFFSGVQAEARAAALSAAAKDELKAQQARIADLEVARAKAKDEAGRQKLDTELATAKALESAKRLESEQLTAASARLAEEQRLAEATTVARKDYEASEAARTVAMKDEAARLRKEYENLVRVDDSAPEFLRQINALEKALKEIGDRYEAIKRDGEKGIAAVYVHKAEALKVSLVMEPWENDRDFAERVTATYSGLDSQKMAELISYSVSVATERAGQEKVLKDSLAKVEAQFSSTIYTQGGASLAVSAGSFDRDAKFWPITVRSTTSDFSFRAELRYSIALAPDIGAVYRAFDAACKAGALAAEVDYSYLRQRGADYVPAMAIIVRIKDLTTGKAVISEPYSVPLFWLVSSSPGNRLGMPILRLNGGQEGTVYSVNGLELKGESSEIAMMPGFFTVTAEALGYSAWQTTGNLVPGQMIEKTVLQEKNGLLETVLAQGGRFMMGSNSGDTEEKPVHQVTVSTFMIGKYEVTQEQYQKVMGANPSRYTSGSEAARRPVENVSWYKAVEFCNRLSDWEGFQRIYTINGTLVGADFSKNGYRLPTEAEWEYAAKGGSLSRGYTYSGSNDVSQVAWYGVNSSSTTHTVGTMTPNELGLYDMSGNVWEWCWDWLGKYPSIQQVDPQGASSGNYRVYRGGAWGYSAGHMRSASRYSNSPGDSYRDLGFRVVRRP